MATIRFLRPVLRTSSLTSSTRTFSVTANPLAEQTTTNPFEHLNSRGNDTAPQYRKYMLSKPLTPHMTNTTSTIANEFPSVGADKPPADQITSVDPGFVPTDSVPENTKRMTGGTQKPSPSKGGNAELDVGEIDGGTFKVEPYRRTGEDFRTLRARLLCVFIADDSFPSPASIHRCSPNRFLHFRELITTLHIPCIDNSTLKANVWRIDQSRKRGTLESDLLLSHFAATYLERMTASQLAQYDVFLDENDWDIYYWATQEPPSQGEKVSVGEEAGRVNAEATGPSEIPRMKTAAQVEARRDSSGPESKMAPTGGMKPVEPAKSEWAQTVGTFKPAYRPVPKRWRNSEILAMLRKHVMENSAGGVHEETEVGKSKVSGEGYARSVKTGGKGLGFMPELTPVT